MSWCTAEPAPSKKVLVLYSYSAEVPVQGLFTRGLQQGFGQNWPGKIDYMYEYLDLERFTGESYHGKLAEHLREKYASARPDLIVSHFELAAKFLTEHGDRTFPGVPAVLSLYEGEGEGFIPVPADYRAVVGTYGTRTAVELILKAQPQVKKIYVVAGDGERERKGVAGFASTAAEFADRAEFIYLTKLPLSELLDRVKAIGSDGAIFFLYYFRDVEGNLHIPGDVLKKIHAAAPVPVYGSVSVFIGQGTVGGYMASQEVLGRQAGALAADILRGNIASHGLRERTVAAEYIFDWRELERWGIDKKRLPAGSRLEFRQASLWETYRWQIIFALLLLAVQAAGIGLLLANRRRRRKAEQAVHRLNEQLAGSLHQQQELITALEEEAQERQVAQDELAERREWYGTVMNQSSEAIAVIELSTRQIIEINEAFSRMFGYPPPETVRRGIDELRLLSREEAADMEDSLQKRGTWSARLRHYPRRNGQTVYAELAAALMSHQGRQLAILSYRDITAQQKLQAEIQHQVMMAGTVQASLLPSPYRDKRLVIETVFQPALIVSGDFFNFRWYRKGKILHGYVIDVTGHGVATALYTSAISSILNAMMDNEEAWTKKALDRLNRHLMNYFPDDTFVALTAFTVDFTENRLSCFCGGNNYILLSTDEKTGLVTLSGMFFGIAAKLDIGTAVFPFTSGDTFYFMTDGLYDRLQAELVAGARDFAATVAGLQTLAVAPGRDDDSSALCLQIGALTGFPRIIDYSEPAGRAEGRRRIASLLEEIAGSEAKRLEVAVGEALINAARAGQHVKVKINKLGARLIVRVKDDGPGFAGNDRLADCAARGADKMLAAVIDAEDGRGIPIMMLWTDRVLYSRKGNEVLLIKKL